MDQHNHLNEAMIFNIKCKLSLVPVCESLKIWELSSWNPLVTSLALTFSSPLIYFSEKTHLKSINFYFNFDFFNNYSYRVYIKFLILYQSEYLPDTFPALFIT